MNQPARDTVIDQWTGRHATALQAALRMSQDEMAALIGVAKRTIASWSERPDIIIRPELQRALDTAYSRADEPAKLRFARQLKADDDAEAEAAAGGAVALAVAIAVVTKEPDVLLVCRRDADPSGIDWQFPAGIVKPGATPSTVAVRETLAETGVHCTVRSELGSRVHPLSGVNASYFLCDYLAGEVENRDVIENTTALWAPKEDVTRFIPKQRIYAPVLRALEGEE
ncbi:NUDIX domain-containing protein [Actinoplanes sp. TFC3]|uniref:NUDIX hydrolase n=1 Tax=Actinoplanes sp. TFC3 TaxID=1710355 RepID=UPI00083057C7|nr:NUDIX domain-containing protein [Actinoplanes sp. TFC3]